MKTFSQGHGNEETQDWVVMTSFLQNSVPTWVPTGLNQGVGAVRRVLNQLGGWNHVTLDPTFNADTTNWASQRATPIDE